MKFREWFKDKRYYADPIQLQWWSEKVEEYLKSVEESSLPQVRKEK